MSNSDDLESLCEYLESHAGDYKYPHQIGDLFQKLRDTARQKGDAGTQQKAQWETDAFHFSLKDGGADAFFSQADAKGQIIGWPDIRQSTEEALAHFDNRAATTANAVLKARYAHILWCSPKKHQKYARMAIEAYLDLVRLYEEKDRVDPNAHFGLDVLDSVKNAHHLACQVKWKLEDVAAEVKRLISDFNRTSSSAFAVRVNLIKLVVRSTRGFSKGDLDGLAEICWRTSLDLETSSNLHNAIKMLELGQKVDAKTGRSSHSWDRQMGGLYEKLMNQREPGDLAAPEFCRQAIEKHRQAGDHVAATRLEKEYERLKQAMRFGAFGGEVDLSDMVRRSVEIADRLMERSPEDTIKWLMGSPSLLPDYKDVEESAEAAMGKYIFAHIMPVTVLDHAGNPAQHFVELDERKYHAMLQDYQIYIETVTRLYLQHVLIRAIESEKLNATLLIGFLQEHSWIGQDLTRGRPDEAVAVYNWLGLVAPGLYQYFEQMRNWITSREYRPNFVVTIDSLVLKIEGLLRDICRLSGGTTSYSARDSKDRTVEREKDIHMLLYDPQVVKLIGFDDLLFLRFLLVEKAGYNLRHRVAHALLLPGQYAFDYANLLVLALLRLAKYDFRQPDDTSQKQ